MDDEPPIDDAVSEPPVSDAVSEPPVSDAVSEPPVSDAVSEHPVGEVVNDHFFNTLDDICAAEKLAIGSFSLVSIIMYIKQYYI